MRFEAAIHHLLRYSKVVALAVCLSTAAIAHAQYDRTGTSNSRDFGGFQTASGTAQTRNSQSNRNRPSDSSAFNADTSATKGLVYVKETPDSVLRKKVFFFNHIAHSVKIDELWNPTLDPTGVQFSDPLDGLNGDFFIGQGTIGHPHQSLFPSFEDGISHSLQSHNLDGYLKTPDNIRFYQTMTPYTVLSYNNSLKKDYPMLIKKLAFYQNDNYVRAQMQANNEANKRWDELLNKADKVQSYSQSNYQDGNWKTINQDNWNWRGTGSVWLRQHININKERAGKPARLLLGTLFDQDVTYLNGKEIGHTYYQYPPRRYDIPEGLLREGDNVIAIRFINKYGAAHFIPEKPYLIAFGDDRFSQNPMPKDVIPLGKTWKMHVGAEMPSCPSGDVSMQNQPTTLYNAVLYPLAPYAINGVVWYQGESNTGNPTPYADYLKKLMGCWRDRWQEQLPFCIVQLANYDGRQQTGNPRPIDLQDTPVNYSGWASLREAQRLAAKNDALAELAVINDLGETVDIHPLRKKEVAERIGLCFDRLIYNNNKVKLSPEVISTEVQDVNVVLTLDQPVQAGTLFDFELAGADGRFVKTEAVVVANKPTEIILRKVITAPKKVRYAWKDNPIRANVRSLSGLPMSSFEIKL